MTKSPSTKIKPIPQKKRKTKIKKKTESKIKTPSLVQKINQTTNNLNKNVFNRDNNNIMKTNAISKIKNEKEDNKDNQQEKRQYYTMKSLKIKENNDKILSNKASSLLKKIFKKSTKDVQKKQILRKFDTSQRNSSRNSITSHQRQQQSYHDYENLIDFAKYFEINFTQISKLANIDVLIESRNRLYDIYDALKTGKNSYEVIRSYTNQAQHPLFEILPTILNDKKAQNLIGKILKFERWSVILIFYFKVAEKKNDELSKLLVNLIDHVWTNQKNLFCWLNLLKKKYNIEIWDLKPGKTNFKEVHYDMENLIVNCKRNNKFISGFLIKS